MTKKHFTMMAIEFGDLYRQADWKFDDGSTTAAQHVAELDTIRKCEEAFISVAKRSNPRFDGDKFTEFGEEVRNYKRDLDGKLIK